MNTSTIVIIVIVGILLLLAFYVIGVYNKLVNARNKVDNQFSQVDVQLKRRADLIPNLVETVKGYANHEKETLEDVIKARNTFLSATTKEDEMKANGELTNAISKLFALAESYPDLKANENFKELSKELSKIEEDIANSRKYYNGVVKVYNNKVEMFPSNLVAGMFGYKAKTMFEALDSERENVKVKF